MEFISGICVIYFPVTHKLSSKLFMFPGTIMGNILKGEKGFPVVFCKIFKKKIYY